MTDKNTGILGPESLRLNGRKIENLPIAEGARAKDQIPEVYKADRESRIEAIKARYPKGSVLYYESRIKECKENIERVQNYKNKLQSEINSYTASLTLCEFREKEEAKIAEDDPDRKEKIRELRKQFPPYNVEEMKKQIVQFEEGIQRSDEVIATENASIAELSEAIGRCKQRDLELKNLGA